MINLYQPHEAHKMRVLCTSIALTAAVLVLIQLLQLLLVLGLQPDGLFILLLLLRAHTFP